MANPIQVAIVEDDPSFRSSIEQMLLSANDRFSLAGSFPDGESAVCGLPALRPQVILMDINLPGISGVDCVQKLSESLPETEIMMLTVSEDSDRVFESIRAGATGYLVKRDVFEKLYSSIISLRDGGSPMSNSVARKVMLAFRELANPPEKTKLLTEREEQILAALAHGKLYKEIADDLRISFNTVRAHVRNIYKKLQVSYRAAAVHKFKNGART